MDAEWDRIEVTVERIANGFLVRESKQKDYSTAYSERLFYPSMESVERELLVRLRAATTLDMSKAEDSF